MMLELLFYIYNHLKQKDKSFHKIIVIFLYPKIDWEEKNYSND